MWVVGRQFADSLRLAEFAGIVQESALSFPTEQKLISEFWGNIKNIEVYFKESCLFLWSFRALLRWSSFKYESTSKNFTAKLLGIIKAHLKS